MITQDNTINWYSMSNQSIVTELVAILRQFRLNQNLTQEQLAEKAGLSRSAISEMENGKAATSLLTVIQVLKALQRLYLLDNWQVAGQINTLQTAGLSGNKRVRAARSKRNQQKEEHDFDWLL